MTINQDQTPHQRGALRISPDLLSKLLSLEQADLVDVNVNHLKGIVTCNLAINGVHELRMMTIELFESLLDLPGRLLQSFFNKKGNYITLIVDHGLVEEGSPADPSIGDDWGQKIMKRLMIDA